MIFFNKRAKTICIVVVVYSLGDEHVVHMGAKKKKYGFCFKI